MSDAQLELDYLRTSGGRHNRINAIVAFVAFVVAAVAAIGFIL